jgi:hypothetical protein
MSILEEVKPLTGEPDAGDPHVRFGGRGSEKLSLPLSDMPPAFAGCKLLHYPLPKHFPIQK